MESEGYSEGVSGPEGEVMRVVIAGGIQLCCFCEDLRSSDCQTGTPDVVKWFLLEVSTGAVK